MTGFRTPLSVHGVGLVAAILVIVGITAIGTVEFQDTMISVMRQSAILAIAATGLLLFLASPFSMVLNFITVPLGYEWQTCPHCPDFGLEKIERANCENCGKEHAINWGAASYRDGEQYRFCSSECMDKWKQ